MSHPQPWARTPASAALPVALSSPTFPWAAEQTVVDPLGTEPTQQLPRSPWERDHLR